MAIIRILNENKKQEKIQNRYFNFLVSFSQKIAFTLAEVLIVIGIIGVVAEMTIPTLVQSTQRTTNIASLKKAYSSLSQAYTMAVQENGTPDQWGITGDGAGSVLIMNTIKPYFKVTKDCGLNGDCFSGDIYHHLSGTSRGTINEDTSIAKVRLSDGTLWGVAAITSNCNVAWGTTDALKNICGYFYVDVNGSKKPNIVGKDFFLMYITKEGIIPVGSQNETAGYPFSSACVGGSPNGWGCTAWIIYNENMDYLKCPSSLSWSGQTKCG